MAVQPLDDRILIKPLDAEEKTAGGIVLPDTAKEKPMQATVIAVGTGKLLKDGTRAKSALAVGNTVLFGKYAGDEIKIDGESHLILREDETVHFFLVESSTDKRMHTLEAASSGGKM